MPPPPSKSHGGDAPRLPRNVISLAEVALACETPVQTREHIDLNPVNILLDLGIDFLSLALDLRDDLRPLVIAGEDGGSDVVVGLLLRHPVLDGQNGDDVVVFAGLWQVRCLVALHGRGRGGGDLRTLTSLTCEKMSFVLATRFSKQCASIELGSRAWITYSKIISGPRFSSLWIAGSPNTKEGNSRPLQYSPKWVIGFAPVESTWLWTNESRWVLPFMDEMCA